MVIFVWRNISSDRADPEQDRISLDFTSSFGSIGGTDFTVDNGQRTIGTRYGGNGSGVTITTYLDADAFKNVIHEFSHYLFGGNDYHNGIGFWGMLSAWGTKSYVANSWERYKLGWMNDTTAYTIANSPNRTLSNQTLGDYLETGHSYRYVINEANGDYIFVENHQKTNYWENNTPFWHESGTSGYIEEGIYVIRKDGGPNDFDEDVTSKVIQCVPAEGRFDWEVNQLVSTSDGNQPVYKNLGSDITNGYHDLEWIPYTYNGTSDSTVIWYIEDENGNPVEDIEIDEGDGLDAFRIGYNEVFSPWSNPNNQKRNRSATNFGFYLKDETNGIYTLDFYVGTSEDAPPSKPQGLSVENSSKDTTIVEEIFPGVESYMQKSVTESSLSWHQNQEDDFDYYKIYRAVTTGSEPSYSFVDTTSSTSIVINNYDIDGDCKKTYYRIIAVDTDGLESVYSESTWDYARPTKPSLNITRYQGHPKLSWASSCDENMPFRIEGDGKNGGTDTTLTVYGTYWVDTSIDWPTTHYANEKSYYYQIQKRRTSSLKSNYSNKVEAWEPGGSVPSKKGAEKEDIPLIFALSQNYPNPFNPSTQIKYQLPQDSYVVIKLYDMLGQEIREIINSNQHTGYYELSFDGSDLPSGMYIYKITAGDFTDSKKLLLLK